MGAGASFTIVEQATQFKISENLIPKLREECVALHGLVRQQETHHDDYFGHESAEENYSSPAHIKLVTIVPLLSGTQGRRN